MQGPWQAAVPRLLVFDNREEERLPDAWRPPSGGCRVLVTSRRSEWSPALLLSDQGDPAAACPLFERAFAIRERVLGPNHPDTVATRRALEELAVEGDGAGALIGANAALAPPSGREFR